MNVHSIRFKLPFIILSITILSMLLLTLMSGMLSKQTIERQIGAAMNLTASNKVATINSNLSELTAIVEDLAVFVAATYDTTSALQYENLLKEIVFNSPYVSGSGIWFEPFIFEPLTKYKGIYAIKNGDTAKITYEYNGEVYDYFNQDWYSSALQYTTPQFTQPFYDDGLQALISSCRMPIYRDNQLIGIITSDINLSMINDIISSIVIDNTHNAFVVDNGGNIVSFGSEFINPGKENDSFNTLTQEMLASKNGTGSYRLNQETMQVYYMPIEVLDWILVIQLAENTLLRPVTELIWILVFIALISILITSLTIFLQLNRLVNRIHLLHTFALDLADNNLTVDALHIYANDELGQLGTSLNTMYTTTKSNMHDIKGNALTISDSSIALKDTTGSIHDAFKLIADHSQEISHDMMSSSAATEELNASIEEVRASIHHLSTASSDNTSLVLGIRKKATETQGHTQTAYNTSTALVKDCEQKLSVSIEEIKVVQIIGTMADNIAKIADQINLLSLNASIEAARAGEQGHGFAVVASEIGKLAKSTSDTVNDVQEIISKVQLAVNTLTHHTVDLLDFISNTVRMDYTYFLDVAKTYETDALSMEESAVLTTRMTENIETSIHEITSAVQDIAVLVQNSATKNDTIATRIQELLNSIDDLAKLTHVQTDIAGTLSEIVSVVKLPES